MKVQVMLAEVLTKIIRYTPEAMKKGSMWWWILPLAPDVLKRQMVAMVAGSVEGHTLAHCGHFMAEEQPEEVMTYIRALAEKAA